MASDGSVTAWIERIRDGDSAAECCLVNAYFERVASVARQHLGISPRRAHDEEDVANTVFRNFLERAKTGGFRKLDDRGDLYQILMMLTKRKAIDYYRKAMRRAEYECGESAFLKNAGGTKDRWSFAEIAKVDPPDELTNEIADAIRYLFSDLSDESLQLDKIAIWRLQGYSVNEIAERLGRLPRTVYRQLHLIQQRWLECCLAAE